MDPWREEFVTPIANPLNLSRDMRIAVAMWDMGPRGRPWPASADRRERFHSDPHCCLPKRILPAPVRQTASGDGRSSSSPGYPACPMLRCFSWEIRSMSRMILHEDGVALAAEVWGLLIFLRGDRRREGCLLWPTGGGGLLIVSGSPIPAAVISFPFISCSISPEWNLCHWSLSRRSAGHGFECGSLDAGSDAQVGV
jgi:hypothetical protein